MKYLNRPVTANAVVIQKGKILLIKRKNDPFKNYWAIPGGFVDRKETTKATSLRELKEEAGISAKISKLIGIYDAVGRDPRHTVNIAYLVSPLSTKILAGDDAAGIKWHNLNHLPKLAFDHKQIVNDALKLLSSP